MSGTYQLSTPGGSPSTLTLFPCNPLTKTPRLDRLATGGTGEPIYSNFFIWDFGWESLPIADALFFESRQIAGGLYYAKLPHPKTGQLVAFTGVVIEDVRYSINDVERDSWVDSLSVTLRCGFMATGGF